MLLLLLCLLPLVACSRTVAQKEQRHDEEAVATTTTTMRRPHIYYCRSPNMEDFTCWWHPLDGPTDGEDGEDGRDGRDGQDVTYILTYSNDKGPKHECPDYVSAGPNSCHFDSRHTSIWTYYCMNVTAVTAHRNYTSQQHCLDVAEIVQTEAPVDLNYTLSDAGGDELGHNALLTWRYPVPSHLQYGWITLVYELQYRRITEPDNWKVKHPLREPHVELLGLPVGDYVVRVRCRSHNSGLWSKWSSALSMSIPTRPPTGKLLVLILVTGVGVVALLVVTFGIIPQSRRIKDYFLPPVPKPRILGIDPQLLKKGNLDEINRHFSSFHSYKSPSYYEEVWDQVSADDAYLTSVKDYGVQSEITDERKETFMVPSNPMPTTCTAAYVSPYCSMPPQAFAPPLDVPSPWPRPEIVSLPGTDYSMAVPASGPAPFTAGHAPPQDFYTCVQLMNESGEVHLVPCLPPAYCQEFPPLRRVGLDAAEKDEKRKKLSDYQTRKNGMKDGGGDAERSEAAEPLLPAAVDNKG